MKISWNLPFKLAAYITAFSTIFGTVGYGSWRLVEATGLRPVTIKEFKVVMDNIEALTYANAANKFERLEERLKRGDDLSWEDKRDFCTNAHILKYPVEGSYGLTCTSDGQPDLVIRVSP